MKEMICEIHNTADNSDYECSECKREGFYRGITEAQPRDLVAEAFAIASDPQNQSNEARRIRALIGLLELRSLVIHDLTHAEIA